MSEPEKEGADRSAAGPEPRCGFIAVIGAPNAGKSTLVNALVGAKVAIVSHKVQTTRSPVRGIATEGESQLVFIDTPGMFEPRRRLERAMVDAAWGGAHDADFIVLVIDAAKGLDTDLEGILGKLRETRAPRIAVLNKVDRVADKGELLGLAQTLEARGPFERMFMLSALSGEGVADLKAYLATRVPVGPWHYPADDLTDVPLRTLAAEITREKIYNRLHDELPYASTVETTSWQERKDGSVRIEQTIFVAREGQKAIVLGKGGQTIKQISTDSRKELTEILERPVHLFLFVKVREGWQDDPERYREMGLEIPKK
ncbi:MAG TPA: GTPase Era [Hyphomicrobium sp.]|jgi:GTPase|nr:GTPase Era [Hyphomicrobium sp.]